MQRDLLHETTNAYVASGNNCVQKIETEQFAGEYKWRFEMMAGPHTPNLREAGMLAEK